MVDVGEKANTPPGGEPQRSSYEQACIRAALRWGFREGIHRRCPDCWHHGGQAHAGCHPALPPDRASVSVDSSSTTSSAARIAATVEAVDRRGVEMESPVAATVAGLRSTTC
jgi:hypothetical protein